MQVLSVAMSCLLWFVFFFICSSLFSLDSDFCGLFFKGDLWWVAGDRKNLSGAQHGGGESCPSGLVRRTSWAAAQAARLSLPPSLTSSAWGELGTLFDAGAPAAQGQTKRNFSHVQRSMLFYGNLGLIYSWLSSFSSTRVPLPFVLGMNTYCKYICTYPHTYTEWMEP